MHRYRVKAPRTAIFPMDMVRFSQSWPWSSDDATAIERSIRVEGDEKHIIELACPHEEWSSAFIGITKRWMSFGWRVEVLGEDGDWRSPGPFIHEAA